MRHLNTFEPAGQDFKRISSNDYMKLVYSPTELFNNPNCQSPEELEMYMSKVVSLVGSKPVESQVKVISATIHQMTLVRADALSTNPRSCYVGFRMTFIRPESQEDKTYWKIGGLRKFSFTRPGLIHKLVDWLDRGNRGTYLEFLAHVGRVAPGALPGQHRGQHTTFFRTARAAGIISLRREGRRHIVVPGPNYEDFKSGRLRPVDKVVGNSWLYVDAIFLNDDWVALKVFPWTDYSKDQRPGLQIFKCDGISGVEAAMLEVLGLGQA